MLQPDDILYGKNVNDIARICGVDLATARRWKRGATCPPQAALMILAGDLGCFHESWSGWKINDRGELCSPENWSSTPGAVRGLQMMHATLGVYRRENAALKAALKAAHIDSFEEQPLPGNWDIAETK